jgi:hypothetical protein
VRHFSAIVALACVLGAAACKTPPRGACTWAATDKTGAPIEICKETTAKDCAPVAGDPAPPTFTPRGACARLGYVCQPGDVGFPPPETVWRRRADGTCPAGSSPP